MRTIANLVADGYEVIEGIDTAGEAVFKWVQGDREGRVWSTEEDAWIDAGEDDRLTANEYLKD